MFSETHNLITDGGSGWQPHHWLTHLARRIEAKERARRHTTFADGSRYAEDAARLWAEFDTLIH